MKILVAAISFFLLASCSQKNYHTVAVKKPRVHHTWYKDHKWHRKLQVGRVRVRWFEKQGAKTVRMRG